MFRIINLADDVCHDGSAHGAALPFTRLTSADWTSPLFIGDNGAFGIKVGDAAPVAASERGRIPFGFPSMAAMYGGAGGDGLYLRLVAEGFGIDRNK